MIKYQVGHLYLLRNSQTLAGSYFRPAEVIPYNGHQVLWGELLSYEIRIGKGPIAVRTKPTGFGQPNLERYGEQAQGVLEMLVRRFGGNSGQLRNYVSVLPPGRDPQVGTVKHGDGPEELLYALGRIEAEMLGGQNWKENWEGRTPNRDGVILCARRSLDLFDDTVRLGRVPQWFLNARQDAVKVVAA